MAQYRALSGEPQPGQVVVHIVKAGEGCRAWIAPFENPEDDGEATVFPSEQMECDRIFRMVESRLDQIGNTEVMVVLEPGVEWDRRWGELVQ